MMQRRDLLRGLASLPLAVFVAPNQAHGLGGQLPPLDQPAPDFRLPAVVPRGDRSGKPPRETSLSLADFGGRWLVLYFYPRDFTSGCTLEARGFQRDLEAFDQAEATVVGVSADDAESHASFCGDEGLAFPLLSDPGGSVSARYGSWIPPYSQRHTFLIDPIGILRARWLAVRPQGHSQEVLEELRRLQRASEAQPGVLS